MMAAAPVRRYQTLHEVKQTHAYTGLNDVQKAVVRLLFTFYENYHYFTVQDDVRVADSLHTHIDRALKTLYYTGGVPAGGNDFTATLSIIIEFENDSFFAEAIGDGPFLVAMDAIRILYDNKRSLPVFLPVTVVPHNGPNIWVAREQQLVDSVSQAAYDAANAVDDAKREGITLGQETLRRYLRIMKSELRKPIWQDLQRHAEGNPQSQAGYEDNRLSITQGVTDAMDMQEANKRPSIPRAIKRGPGRGGKQSSKRRTMSRQQYKRRRRRTLHRR